MSSNENQISGKYFSKKFKFRHMENWNHELYESAHKFHDKFTIYPNVLISNPFTQSRIDRMANGEDVNHIFDHEGEAPEDDVRVNSFCTEDFEIDFCYDDKLKHPEYILIFDEDYDGGGEDIDEEGEEEQQMAV